MIEIESVCQMNNVWDRRTLALWHRAQGRHRNRIRIRPKEEFPRLFTFMTYFAALLNSIFCGVSAVFDRRRSIRDGFVQGWRETPNFLFGEFTTFSYTIYVPGDGSILKQLPPEHRFAVLWHQLSHIDWLYLGYPHCAERHHNEPKRWFGRRLYDEWINANMVRFMWFAWRFPFGAASFRQEFEYFGFLCEVRVELYLQGHTSNSREQILAALFSGPEYGYMSTKKGAKATAIELVEQAENERRNGWTEAKLEDLDRYFESLHGWSRVRSIAD